jgi:hypothetical protein
MGPPDMGKMRDLVKLAPPIDMDGMDGPPDMPSMGKMDKGDSKDKLMGMGEDTFDKVDRITDPVELNLNDPEEIEDAKSMSAEELKDELEGDIYHLMDKASDDFTDNDHIVDEMGDHFASMHLNADDKTLSCYSAMRDLVDADPSDVYETGKKCLKILGAQEHQDQEQGNKGPKGRSTNEDGMARGIGTLDKFRELYRKGIGSDDDEVVLRELIEVINDDALFADEFPELKAFTSASEFDDSEIVTAKDVPGDTADEKIESLIKAIDDDEWVESFVITLMKDFNIDGGENEELDRIKELSGVNTNEEALSKCCDAPISDGPGDAEGRCTSCGEVVNVDEQTFEGEEFYEYYGYLPWHEDIVDEAEYQGRKVKLGKPMQGDVKKFKVYVRDPKTKNIKKVNFGDPNMRIKKSNPKRRKSFRARHNCANPGPRTKARYWSCRKW